MSSTRPAACGVMSFSFSLFPLPSTPSLNPAQTCSMYTCAMRAGRRRKRRGARRIARSVGRKASVSPSQRPCSGPRIFDSLIVGGAEERARWVWVMVVGRWVGSRDAPGGGPNSCLLWAASAYLYRYLYHGVMCMRGCCVRADAPALVWSGSQPRMGSHGLLDSATRPEGEMWTRWLGWEWTVSHTYPLEYCLLVDYRLDLLDQRSFEQTEQRFIRPFVKILYSQFLSEAADIPAKRRPARHAV